MVVSLHGHAVPGRRLHLSGRPDLGARHRSEPARQLGHGTPRRVAAGLGGAKLVAIGFGMLLHLRRVHNVVALLTAIYFAVAILPWAALFLMHDERSAKASSQR